MYRRGSPGQRLSSRRLAVVPSQPAPRNASRSRARVRMPKHGSPCNFRSNSICLHCARPAIASPPMYRHCQAKARRLLDRRRGLITPAAARADCGVVALERICIADVARVPQDLNARQQLDITGRAAGCHHADAFALIGRAIFGPVLLQRILRRRFVAETRFLITPENDRPAPGSLATRPDLERRRTAGRSSRVFCSRRCALGLPLPAGHIRRLPLPSIRGQIPDVWLPMSDWHRLRRCPDRVLLGPSGARGDDSYRNAHTNCCRSHDIAPFTKSVDTMRRHMRDADACRDHIGKELSSYYCNYSNDKRYRSKPAAPPWERRRLESMYSIRLRGLR
jgi:hypothetical protein